jgi:hypothetical protein
MRVVELEGVKSTRNSEERIVAMSDEMEQHLDSIHTERRNKEEFEKWRSRYSASDKSPHILWGELSVLDCPHLDLLQEFTRRASHAGLSKRYALLTAPDGTLTLMSPHDSKHPVKKSGQRGSWLDKEAARRANKRLEVAGRPGMLFHVYNSEDGGPNHVNASWLVVNNEFYNHGRPLWGTREAFARECAGALVNAEKLR